jgi:signal peptidase I
MSPVPGKVLNTDQADLLELSRELLDRGGLLRFQAHGRSMYPFIKNGDVILVEPRNGDSVGIGDIIFYRRQDDSLAAHRLIKITRRKNRTILFTKGDSLRYTDPPVTGGQVMGRVIMIEGSGRQFKLNNWPGHVFARLVAWTARGRYPNQRRLVRYIDRFGRLLLGRRIK